MLVKSVVVCECVLLMGVYGFLFPDDSTRTVSTPVGDIVGNLVDVFVNSTTSYKVQRFKGIPYAEAPAGNLRFKKPVPKAPFQTAFDARQDSFACLQITFPLINVPFRKAEDCLRLNVFVPGNGSTQSDGSSRKPVMIWIHGGGFAIGASYNPRYDGSVLSTFGDVIVVTINYRLAQFGFLSTGDSVLPGNLGLWDQQLAIKWVHDNIQAFGGDTKRITIFGESAGSSSVMYQAFYPGNKGLFQRAIAQSGSITSPFALKTPEKNLQDSRNFSIEAGCSQTSSAEYIQCLSSKPIDLLNQLVSRLPFERIPLPVFDGDFILDEPAKLLSGKTNASTAIDMFESVDIIIGFNNNDGVNDLFRWLASVNSFDADTLTIPKQLYEQAFVSYYVNSYYVYNTGNVTQTALLETIHSYTDWSAPENDTNRLNQLVDLATDSTFVVPTVNTANLHTNSTRNTYVYEFTARPALGHILQVPKVLDGPNVANHGDEIPFVFGVSIRNESENSALSKQFGVTQAMMTFWTNFAKSGNPNTPGDPTQYTNTAWPSYKDDEEYLEIGLDMGQHSVKSRVRPAAVNLWNVLLPALMKSPASCN